MIRIYLCINNPNNGESTRSLWAIQFGESLHLESNFYPDPGVTCYKCDDKHIKIGRRKFPIINYDFWIGNWCWDAISVEIETAQQILDYIQSMRLHDRQKFGVEEGLTELTVAYERGYKVNLKKYESMLKNQ